MANVFQEVKSVNIQFIDDAELIALAQKAQRAVNQRIRRLESAGLKSRVTTSGVQVTSVAQIKTRAQAKRAINRARTIAENPLSTPGAVRKVMRQASKDLGVPQTQIKMAVDKEGKPITARRGEPYKRPLKRTKLSEEENIRRFWHFIEGEAGRKAAFVSDTNMVQNSLEEALENGVNAVSQLKRNKELDDLQKAQAKKAKEVALFPNNSRIGKPKKSKRL